MRVPELSRRRYLLWPLFLCSACFATASDLEQRGIVDLSHPYNDKTLYWPAAPSRFELETLDHGITERGWFYSANRFRTPEHGGTHVDAPYHFSARGRTVDQIPLRDLIGPAVVIDVAGQAAADPDYRLTVGDIEVFESANGRVPAGAIVLMHTGWSARWPNAKAYLGDDRPGEVSGLHFPGYGEAAAGYLIEQRQIAALGVDTASIDYGQSRDFPVHRLAAGHNVPGLENLTNLDRLPATGADLIALPMKIEGGSGAPVRVIALLPSE